MKKLITIFAAVALFMILALPVSAETTTSQACYGQASAVFAQMGEMGEHASSYETPRLGLRNLARVLADAGILPDDSMTSLGQFVANELGLSIEACLAE